MSARHESENVRRANTNVKTCKKCGETKPLTEFQRDWRYVLGVKSSCRLCLNEYSRVKRFAIKYAKRNPEKIKAYRKKWLAKNKERYDSSRRRWVRENGKKVLAETRKYQAAKIHRTPKWLTKEQKLTMRTFYENCPDGYEVDHIVPLQGKEVSGLHVPWNLQYLEMRANRRKSNTVKC